MDLDDMKAKWAEHDTKLSTVIRLNQQLLQETHLNRVQSVLQRSILARSVEVVVAVGLLIWIGSFLYDHLTEARFFLPALLLHLMAMANLGILIRQIVATRQIAYNKPVAETQKDLEIGRILSIRHIQWILLLSPLIWILFLIVGFKGFFGADVYRIFPVQWIVVNIVIGVAVIPVALTLAKLFHTNPRLSPFLRRMANGLAGTEWIKAEGFLTTLSDFVDEQEQRTSST